MLTQQVACGASALSAHAVGVDAHALLHYENQLHHHHGDGDFHVDDSPESLAHCAIDCGTSFAVVFCSIDMTHAVPDALLPLRGDCGLVKRPPDNPLRPPSA